MCNFFFLNMDGDLIVIYSSLLSFLLLFSTKTKFNRKKITETSSYFLRFRLKVAYFPKKQEKTYIYFCFRLTNMLTTSITAAGDVNEILIDNSPAKSHSVTRKPNFKLNKASREKLDFGNICKVPNAKSYMEKPSSKKLTKSRLYKSTASDRPYRKKNMFSSFWSKLLNKQTPPSSTSSEESVERVIQTKEIFPHYKFDDIFSEVIDYWSGIPKSSPKNQPKFVKVNIKKTSSIWKSVKNFFFK